jgi:DNA adenine methylase
MRAKAMPFLKWPGGKRSLARAISERFPAQYERYFEPFAGSAALFFSLQPQDATLADVNADLIDVYRAVRDDVEGVISSLSSLRIAKDTYYKIRASRPATARLRAVRFLYLNRTAFNGIYRVNRKGEFNVPFGCKAGTVLCDKVNLRAVSAVLRDVELECADFEAVFRKARAGDVVYADPPYTTMHDRNGFRRYNEAIFSWADQQRLASAAHDAVKRGVSVLVSNAHHEEVMKLYAGFDATTLTRSSCIAGSSLARKPVTEFLLTSKRLVTRW